MDPKKTTKEIEVLNIYPIKETITVLDLVIPKLYVRIVKTKKNQTLLKFTNKDIVTIIDSYLRERRIYAGHSSFHSDRTWVIPEYFNVEEIEVLPKDCGLTRIKATVAKVNSFCGETVKIPSDLPMEWEWKVAKVDNKFITNY